MAIDYGKRAGLRGSSLYYLDTGLNPSWNEETRELESNDVPNLVYPEDFDKSIEPFYGQNRSPVLNGSNGNEENSAYQDGQNSNDDVATSERYQQLLQKREEIRAKIVKLRANIDYQKKLRAQEMAKDPMWDIAKQEYIMKGDATQLNNIMGRFENEKTREANRTSEANAKQESFIKVYRNKQRALDWAMQEYINDKEKIENKRAVFNAYQDLADAAEDAGAKIVKDEQFIQNKYGIDLRQMLNLDSIGKANNKVSTGSDSTATQDLDNFNAAKDSGSLSKMSKAYKAAKESGKVDGNVLNKMLNELEAAYQKQKDAYDKAMESWNFADKIIERWNNLKVHDSAAADLFRKTYGNRGSWKNYINVDLVNGMPVITKVGEDKKPKAPVKDW